MTSETKICISPEEYLVRERAAHYKSEYRAGEVVSMSGASEAHNLIVANLLRELGSQLKGRPCKAYPSDMRVKIPGGQHYLYPDVIVVCGQSQFEDERKDTLLNPTLVIEVLSKSTEAYDRGDKFATYRKLDSLQECVLVSQERCLVEVFRRQPEALWLLSSHDDPKQVVSLPSIQCTLALSEVYDKVEIRA